MHNTRTLRVSSRRELCIFCATRQSIGAAAAVHPRSLSQRRQLNSSTKAPQYASEGLIYKDADDDVQQRPRFGTAQRAPPHPPPSQFSRNTYQSQAPRPHQYQPQRQHAQDRRLPIRNVSLGNSRPNNQDLGRPGSQFQRFNVNMDPRTPIFDSPAFGSGQLRRRNEPQATMRSSTSVFSNAQPTAPRPRMDQAEIERLLNSHSKSTQRGPPRPFTPLSRNTGTRNAPNPTFRAPAVSNNSVKEDRLSDAAEAWVRTRGSQMEAVEPAIDDRNDRRRGDVANERRRSRFMTEAEAPVETRNRYEEPERRRRDAGRATRGRIMREDDEDAEEAIEKAERRRQRKEAKKKKQLEKTEPVPVYLPEYISVANLASLLKVRVEEFVAKLEELGFEDVQNDHILNAEHAGLIAQEYNFEPIVQAEEDDGDLRPAPALSAEEYAELPARPPVVTIMGHVDHGKTTILDYMRSTSVAAGEFGGITQHIGAFSVPLASGKKITFLDTPGHSAFETMRARGANVTDIVVLVVAADDSVMPQTVEAIKHARAANVPIIVAINKIDKSQADPDSVKLDLGRHGIEVEDFGGDVQAICVSGKTGQGIPDLEEAISTLSEMLDHRADPNTNVEGWILEGNCKKYGKVATVLVRSGTLRQGDILVAGKTWARVRTLRNEAGAVVQEVGPGMPVEVDGWRDQPIAGDEVLQATGEQQAQEVSDLRVEKEDREQMAKDMDAINEARRVEAERRAREEAAEKAAAKGETPADQAKAEEGPSIIPFIVKGDVSGSVEAVIDSISALGNGEVGTRVLRHGVGSPSEFDVQHAADAHGHIVNFNTAVPTHIAAMAEEKGVKILDSNIIYRVVDNVKALLEEKLSPKIIQKVTGEAEVAMVFDIGIGGKKKLKVAGSKVRNGVVDKGTKVRVLRKEQVVFDGILNSLKNQKKDVDQMRKDTECGIGFEGWEDFRVGDKIQCYAEEKHKRTL